ncbi:MAG: phosphopantetheine-binding protein [Clostridia bacterium]|nr:phosphopantetheine-binding protein [Clostridia bacterium]
MSISDSINQLRDNLKDSEITIAVSVCPSEEDIAIIGLSGRYPMADNLHDFWENLKSGKDCIREIPKDRWNNNRYFDPDKYSTSTYYSKWGGFLENIDMFDATFFNISPKEAEVIDPQERLFLETVWHAIEDAGYKKGSLSDSDMGVFVGVMFGQYQLFGAEELMKGNYRFSETSYASIANRVSFFLNLHGPSIAIDTMCSSSLVAVHMACESIRRGECQSAIAGGVNLSLHPIKYYLLSQKRFASSDGRCRAFGERGDGYVPGEGVGAVFLKPLKKAVQDGDNIYAVIKGSAINHGGKTNGYTVPNPIAQSEVISKALKKANINPRTISYVEAHGTGTALGDPIEINGLNIAYTKYTNHRQYCSIGSVKTNIGHLESAAGIAALTKVLLQMKNKKLVPSIHSDEINSLIDFKESPFYVQHELENWKRPVIEEDGVERVYPRRAGISAFGAGGVNTHIIVEEYVTDKAHKDVQDSDRQVFILSAKKRHILKEYVKDFVDFIDKRLSMNTGISIRDIAYTLQTGRTEMEERIAFTASDIQEVREKLITYSEKRKIPVGFYQGNAMSNRRTSDLNLDTEQADDLAGGRLDYKDPNRLAELWVSGVSVNWDLLYKENRPNRIPLPTYPFSKEKYWIEQQKGVFQNVKDILEQVKNLLEQVETIIEPDKSVNTSKQSEYKTESNSIANQVKILTNKEQNILVTLYDSPEYERNDIVNEHIQKLTADFLSYIPPSLPEIYVNFLELGMDSVTILDFKSKIEEEFNVEFPSTILYEYSTIEKLSEYISEIIKLDEIETNKLKSINEKHKKLAETSEEDNLKYSSSRTVPKLLDTIISSGEEESGNSEYTEEELKSVIDKLGIF